MTEVPPNGDAGSPAEEPDPGATPSVPPFAQGAYPPPFGADAAMTDDELAAALAAQTAMYTGPITIPLVNSDPTFRPDPAAVHDEMPPPVVSEASDSIGLPPVPVPPPPPPVEYIAPDAIASDPEPPTIDHGAVEAAAAESAAETGPIASAAYAPFAAPPTDAEPIAAVGDDELTRSVANEAAAGSTLDAILLLENELRRRQGLPPVDPADEPPVGIDAAFGAVPVAEEPAMPAVDEPDVPVIPVVPVVPLVEEPAIPGWTPAPDPENEGASPEADDQAWLTAPPPSFTPPPLVEPPAPDDAFDGANLASPTLEPDTVPEAVDPSTLPPPVGLPAGAPPPEYADAPPPVVAATPLTPPPFEALIVGEAVGDPEFEGIDELDRVDLAAPIPVDETGVAEVVPVPVVAGAAAAAAVEPAAASGPTDPEPFAVEQSALEPTPVERRAGHAARMFWLWFAANSSFVMVAVGATLFGLGMSLRQTLVAIVAGVALSALPLGLGTLAGKWSGQPTMTVSRATFGVIGNVVPAILAVLGRVLWGGVMLWLLAASCATLLGDPATPASGLTVSAIVALVVGAVVAGLVAVVGFGLLYRVQRVLGILSTLLLVATIIVTAGRIDLTSALEADDGSWVLAIGGGVVVFSVVGLAWAQSSSDLARYQRTGGSGAANMLWGTFGVILPTLLILAWGALLAASDDALADELARQPLTALAGIVPSWFLLPLLAVTAFGLLSGAILTMYSGGLALVSTGVRVPRALATLIAAALVTVVAIVLLAIGADTRSIVRDAATTLAVPIAAWVGIFASEMMIRLRRFHGPSLLATGGVYPSVRWVNLVGLIVITVVGFGFTSAQLAGLDWQGYLFRAFGIGADDPWAISDVGVLVALLLGLLLPLVAGIPAIRRQERPIAATTGGMPAVDALID